MGKLGKYCICAQKDDGNNTKSTKAIRKEDRRQEEDRRQDEDRRLEEIAAETIKRINSEKEKRRLGKQKVESISDEDGEIFIHKNSQEQREFITSLQESTCSSTKEEFSAKVQEALTKLDNPPAMYSFDTLRTSTKDFHRNLTLGSGNFGDVYKADLQDETVAVKKLKMCKMDKRNHVVSWTHQKVFQEFLEEVKLMTATEHHSNVVQLKGVSFEGFDLLLVYEYVENGTLAKALSGQALLRPDNTISWSQRLTICTQIASALSFLHQRQIVHGDIKPMNVLLDKDYNAKICDFGTAKRLGQSGSAESTEVAVGTKNYIEPELYSPEGKLSAQADVYGLGMTILRILTGGRGMDSSPNSDNLLELVKSMELKDSFLDLLPPQLAGQVPPEDLVRAVNTALNCVAPNPEDRPSAAMVALYLSGRAERHVVDEFVKRGITRRKSDGLKVLEGQNQAGHNVQKVGKLKSKLDEAV